MALKPASPTSTSTEGYKEPSMPFGGVKQSDAGLPENSQTGLEFFVDQKAVCMRG